MKYKPQDSITVRVPTALHKRLKIRATQADLTVQEAVERAVTDWLRRPAKKDVDTNLRGAVDSA